MTSSVASLFQQGARLYGRLGSMYFLHLAEASAQRYAAWRNPEPIRRAAHGPAGEGLAMFLRLLGVMGVSFGAIAALAVMVG